MLTAPRPDFLATADERVVSERLRALESELTDPADPGQAGLLTRIERLRGVLTWRLQTDYHERLTEAWKHLEALNADVEMMTARYQAFVRARQAATHSYVGYEIPINRLRMKVRGALGRLNTLMARQGHMLETVAVNELKLRRERLESYQSQARYAFADSYDRAAKAQAASVQDPADEAVDQAAEPDGEERG
jgi:hypothetical protein